MARPCLAASSGVSVRLSQQGRALLQRSVLAANASRRAAPTQPMAMPSGVRRWSALSARSVSRYSAREVNMR